MTLEETGNDKEAERYYLKAINLSPSEAKVFNLYAGMLFSK